jgi:DNA repair exonuclease SbcCD ATPase subunit
VSTDSADAHYEIRHIREDMIRMREEQRDFRERLNTITSNLAQLQHRVTRIETEDEPGEPPW